MVATSILYLTLAVAGQQGVEPAWLVGVWEVVKGPPGTPAGSTLSFKRDGKFESKIKGTDNTFTGRFRIDGSLLMLEPPGFPATIQALGPNSIVISGLTGPAQYRRQGGGNQAAMPKAGQKTARSRRRVQPKGAGAPASGDWVVVTGSGGYSVRMPGEPNGEESGRSIGDAGEFEYEQKSCERFDSKVDYHVVTLEADKDIPEATAAKAIEQVRDDTADGVGSGRKLVSEKPIRLGPVAGREFTMRVNSQSSGKPVGIQGRAFVKGKWVYLVMAASKVQVGAMPPEAKRFLDSFSLGDGAAGVAVNAAGPGRAVNGEAMLTGGPPATASLLGPALRFILGPTKASLLMGVARLGVSRSMGNRPPAITPMPEPVTTSRPAARPDPMKAWGTETDPDGDVAIETSGRSLMVRIPGTAHVLAPERGKMNAPRVTAPISSDFVATVRVDGPFDPGGKTTVRGLSPRVAGGLVLWKDEKNYLVFQKRASAGDEGNENNGVVLEELASGSKGVTRRQPAGTGPVTLRIERKGGRIAAAFSKDGRSWTGLQPVDAAWAVGELQVGVIAVSTSTGPHAVTFDGYSLKTD